MWELIQTCRIDGDAGMEENGVSYIHGMKYPYISIFHRKSGAYFRTGILHNGQDTGKDPFMADFPELLDVGVMGNCIHGGRGLCQKAGTDCYQDGPGKCQEHMTFQNFKRIIRECRGKTYQIALGGRGDPDQHPDFAKMVEHSCCQGIVPNFTTSGLGLTAAAAKICKEYCGAVAVSWYRGLYTYRAIDLLLQAGVRTNIHYVLSSKTVMEAVQLLEKGGFPQGINAVVFLLYKPVGLGKKDYVLKEKTPYLKEFFELADKGGFPFKIGFDSCTVPGLIRHTGNIEPTSIDTCEGGRWSAYVTPDMYLLPCSFDNQKMKWAVSLADCTIEEAWNSVAFNNFRQILEHSCPGCEKRELCMGGCPICPEIVLCGEKAEMEYVR